MPIAIVRYSEIKYPIQAEDLLTGQIYEGSDKRLYVATDGASKCSRGFKLLAVEVNGVHFITSEPHPQSDFAFREIHVTLTIHD